MLGKQKRSIVFSVCSYSIQFNYQLDPGSTGLERSCTLDSSEPAHRSVEARAAMAGGVRTADGVLHSAKGSDQRSLVGHSRGGLSEPRLAVGGHRRAAAAVRLCAPSDTLCRAHESSCCDGGRCQDGLWRAAQRRGVRSAQLGRAQPRWIERASTRRCGVVNVVYTRSRVNMLDNMWDA